MTESSLSADFPSPDDPRWVEALYAVDGVLRISSTSEHYPLGEPFPDAEWSIRRRVRYIRDMPFPYTTVSFADPSLPDGYVMNGSVRFLPTQGVWGTLGAFFYSRNNQIRALLMLCFLLFCLLFDKLINPVCG